MIVHQESEIFKYCGHMVDHGYNTIHLAAKGVNPRSNMGGIMLGRNIHPACGMYCAGGSRACPSEKIFLNGAIWCIFGSDFVFKKFQKLLFFK